MNVEEQARVRLVIDGKEAGNELSGIGRKIDELKQKQAEYARGSKEYNEVSKELRELEKSYRIVEQRMDIMQMTTAQLAKYQRELRKELSGLVEGTREFADLSNRLTEVNTRMSHLNGIVRGVNADLNVQPGLWSRIKETALGVFAGLSIENAIQKVGDWAKATFNIVTDMDRLKTALKNVSGSTEAYEASLAFLNRTADKYGQSLQVLTGSYTGFIASSNSSNLALKERNRIYESVIQAGSALKLSNEQIEGSLLSISQMFSKGNVQAEELRGQLGERLPGAFGLMAKAMGVTEPMLNKMLEDGQVLAKDALPKLATELTRLYGPNAAENVKSFSGAWNRMVNGFSNYVVAANEANGFTSKLAAGINFLVNNGAALVGIFKTLIVGVTGYYLATNVATGLVKANVAAEVIRNGVLKIGRVIYGEALLALTAYTGMTVATTEAQIAATASATAFNTALRANPFGILALAITAVVAGYQAYNMMSDEAIRKQNELRNSIIDAQSDLRKEGTEFNRLTNTVLSNKVALDDRRAALQKLIDKYPENMKGISTLQDAEAKLGAVIRATNGDFATRARLLENEVKINYNNSLANDALKKKILLENELKNASTSRVTTVTGTSGGLITYDSESEAIKKKIAGLDNLVKQTQKFNQNIADQSDRLSKKIVYNAESEASAVGKSEKGKTEARDKSKKQLEKDLDEIEKRSKVYNENVEKWEKEALKEREDAQKEYAKAVEKIEENLEKKSKTDKKNHAKWEEENQEALGKKMVNLIKAHNKEKEKEDEEYTKKFIEREKQKAAFIEDLRREAFDVAMSFFDVENEALDKRMQNATTAVERFNVESSKEFNEVGRNLTTMVANLASGNWAAGVGNVITFLRQYVASFNGDLRLAEARLQDLYITMKKASDAQAELFDDIERIYGQFTERPQWMKDIAIQLETFSINTIDLEVKKGQMISDNYKLATDKEGEYFEQRKRNIEDAYNLEINRINAKYDLLAVKASQQFSAETLAIQEGVNAQLTGFIANEEQKLRIKAEYEKRRNELIAIYAAQIKPITEGMSKPEIDGINAAIKARDNALAQLEAWQTTELEFVLKNNQLKIDSLAEYEKVIEKGKQDQATATLKYNADEIAANTAKNLELMAVEKARTAELEVEAKRHNDELLRLGLEKDAALAASFSRLKDLVNAGYQEMVDNATKLYNQGIITASQFEELLNRANELKKLVTDFPKLPPVVPPPNVLPNWEIDPIRVPLGFSSGTEFVDPAGAYPVGVDKVPALLNRGERVIPTEYNNLLGKMSNAEMVARALGDRSRELGVLTRSRLAQTGTIGTVSGASAGDMDMSRLETAVGKVETALGKLADIEKAIVNKPVLSMGMLNNATAADKKNMEMSRL